MTEEANNSLEGEVTTAPQEVTYSLVFPEWVKVTPDLVREVVEQLLLWADDEEAGLHD